MENILCVNTFEKSIEAQIHLHCQNVSIKNDFSKLRQYLIKKKLTFSGKQDTQ
jgi:hypothetical protein